jgi:hypothetical protein
MRKIKQNGHGFNMALLLARKPQPRPALMTLLAKLQEAKQQRMHHPWSMPLESGETIKDQRNKRIVYYYQIEYGQND